MVNTDPWQAVGRFGLPLLPGEPELVCEFSTSPTVPESEQTLTGNGKHYRFERLAAGEGRVYRLNPHAPLTKG